MPLSPGPKVILACPTFKGKLFERSDIEISLIIVGCKSRGEVFR